MGVLGTDQYDAELDFDIGRKYNVLGLGTAGVIVMNDKTDLVVMLRNIVRFFAHESCGQCTPCREGTAWMHKILNRIVDGFGQKTAILKKYNQIMLMDLLFLGFPRGYPRTLWIV